MDCENSMSMSAQVSTSVSEIVKKKITKFERGHIFSADSIHVEGSRLAINKSLSRLAEEGKIRRIHNGVYYKPQYSRFIKGKTLPPNINEAIRIITKRNNETIQIHGAVAANRLGLSTQVPMNKVFHTNGISREIVLGGSKVKFIHTENSKLLQYAGTKVGWAISALYYLGKELVNEEVIHQIASHLNDEEFEKLVHANLTGWMKETITRVNNERIIHSPKRS